jgi:hypothetical protein
LFELVVVPLLEELLLPLLTILEKLDLLERFDESRELLDILVQPVLLDAPLMLALLLLPVPVVLEDDDPLMLAPLELVPVVVELLVPVVVELAVLPLLVVILEPLLLLLAPVKLEPFVILDWDITLPAGLTGGLIAELCSCIKPCCTHQQLS